MQVALATTLYYKVTFEANASGPCFAMSYTMNETGGIEDLYFAEVGVGYITTVGEALAKGPIPYPFPGSNVFEYPTDPKTGTPIYPLAYGYDPGNVSGIGSTFANWTVSVNEKHKSLLYLRPEPKPVMGVPSPFAGVFYPEADSLWIPIHYEGFNETYQQISGEGLFISIGAGLFHPDIDIPKGLSWMGVMIFIDGKILGWGWSNQPWNIQVLNPAFPDLEVPAAVAYNINVELAKTQSSTYVYAGIAWVAMIAVIGLLVIKRKKLNNVRV